MKAGDPGVWLEKSFDGGTTPKGDAGDLSWTASSMTERRMSVLLEAQKQLQAPAQLVGTRVSAVVPAWEIEMATPSALDGRMVSSFLYVPSIARLGVRTASLIYRLKVHWERMCRTM